MAMHEAHLGAFRAFAFTSITMSLADLFALVLLGCGVAALLACDRLRSARIVAISVTTFVHTGVQLVVALLLARFDARFPWSNVFPE